MKFATFVVFIFGLLSGLSSIFPLSRATAAGLQPSVSPDYLPNDPRYNPWMQPLLRFHDQPGSYNFNIHMGFINTDYFCAITAERGVDFVRDRRRSVQDDVTRQVFSQIDGCARVASLRIRYGVGDISPDDLKTLLPTASAVAIVQEGKRHGNWGNPETHAKVLQMDDGKAEFYTVHGSLNLQTVGLTCKGNNALRFVERTPTLYGAFAALAEAAAAGSGKGLFPGGRGTRDSSGDDLPDAVIGDYLVSFYGGRGQAFVGGGLAAASRPWPYYINPPYPGQHDAGVVNWYDASLHDAARQLHQGRNVRLDIAVFEIGETAWFVENLFRFVNEGFAHHRAEDRGSNERVASVRPGNLTIRFLWQFQSGGETATTTTAALLKGPAVRRRVDPETGNTYALEMARVWPKFDAAGIPVNPTTPRDMHNKMMLMDVVGHESERKLYVTSSNLDTPGQGSGRLWQAGTIIGLRPGSAAWSGSNADRRQLWNAYKRYFDLLWASREGQPGAGQVAFYQAIAHEHRAGGLNWIETVAGAALPATVPPREGIDAFFFPVPLREH
jgi:hypothetical protein